MATKLVYTHKDFYNVSDITRIRYLGVGTSAPAEANKTRAYIQTVYTNNIVAGTYYNLANYLYIRPSTNSPSTDFRCVYNVAQTAGGSGKQVRSVFAIYNFALVNNGNTVSNMYGSYNNASVTVGTCNNTYGSYSFTTITNGNTATSTTGSYNYAYAQDGATVTNIYGLRALAYNYTNKTVVRQYGLHISTRVQKPNTVTTNNYGIFVSGTKADGAKITNNYSIYFSTPVAGTSTTYVMYSSGNVKSYHRGALGLGAGSTNVGTHQLRVVGTAGLTTGTAWTVFSDARLKNVKHAYKKGLKEICKLNPIVYSYKKDNDLNLDNKERAGLIAQDVQKIFPKAIDSKGEYLQLNVDPINYALINAIKELNKKIESLENKLNKLG